MKVVFVVALLALVCGALASNVVELTPENFDTVVNGEKHVFVEFFAPWCGHCKSLAPTWEELADAYVKELSVVIAKVDADAHRDLGSRFGVSGFPTLKFFPKGDAANPKEYNGGRDLDSLVQYTNTESGAKGRVNKPASKVVVLDPSNFDDVVSNKDKVTLVEFYAPWCGHCKNLAPDWEKLGLAFQNEENVVIAKVDADAHRDIGSKNDVSGFPTLKFFGKGLDAPETYSGGRDLTSLVAAVNAKAGTKRTNDGLFESSVGRVAELDELAEYFMTKKDERAQIVTKAEAAAANSQTGTWYVKYMNVISKKGDSWVATEEARLKSYIADKKTDAKKLDDFSLRLNILQAFQPK